MEGFVSEWFIEGVLSVDGCRESRRGQKRKRKMNAGSSHRWSGPFVSWNLSLRQRARVVSSLKKNEASVLRHSLKGHPLGQNSYIQRESPENTIHQPIWDNRNLSFDIAKCHLGQYDTFSSWDSQLECLNPSLSIAYQSPNRFSRT